jgi:Subtilase family
VPDGKLGALERRVREYLTKENAPKKEGQVPQPKNARLINAISTIRRAAFAELWTDKVPPPDQNQVTVFQIWLRLGSEAPNQVYASFRDAAQPLDVVVEPGYLTFPGRVVIAARSTRAALEQAIDLLDFVAEIRKTSLLAEFFLSGLRPYEQVEWVRDMAGRIEIPPADQKLPRVALFDTGVSRGHPLLSPLIDPADMHAVIDTWDTADHQGHGSEMAGLALHGDLRTPLASRDPHRIPHRLESVKILPDTGENLPHLYGWTCDEAVRLVEQTNADAIRTFSMMTTAIGATTGWPSEWSATLDRLAFGLRGQSASALDLPAMDGDTPRVQPRLFVVAAGNIPWSAWIEYPSKNHLELIEDPGQAWNALTVGAHTDLVDFNHDKWPDLRPIASAGSLSPSSRTSLLWPDRWPVKPDVVAEGGNGCVDGAATPQVTVGPEDLRVITTSHEPTRALLAEAGDTSAAAAEVARICAHLQSRYPSYWPETIRALIVQGAGYTPAMRADQGIVPTKTDRRTLLRRYGHGRVSMESSLNSALNKPTLIQQETIVPYVLEGSTYHLGRMNVHNLPWPKADLQRLGEAAVALKVTLSYFIQPNPSRRGWQSKFRYQSHGLRFAVRGASETTERFHQRINGIKRDEMGDDREESMPDPDNEGWLLRSPLRSQGSLHSDTWYGFASELATKSEIAVFPVGGWWKEIADRTQPDRRVCYALVVSLDVLTNVDVDIYTPIANQIVVPVDIP